MLTMGAIMNVIGMESSLGNGGQSGSLDGYRQKEHCSCVGRRLKRSSPSGQAEDRDVIHVEMKQDPITGELAFRIS